MHKVRSTCDVPPKERLDYWHSLVRDLFDDVSYLCESDSSENFSGEISNTNAGALEVFGVTTAAHRVHRTVKDCAAPAILLTYQLEGVSHISQDGRSDILRPGDFTLFDSSRPFDMQFKGPIKQSVLRIPWESVKQQLLSPQRITGISFQGANGVGHIASTFIRAFVSEAPLLQAAEADRMANSLIDIINATAFSTVNPGSRHTSDYCSFQIRRIRLFIEENLRNPDLSPPMIAAANGISQRYLNKLFESEDISIGRLMWERRLDKCRQELEEPMLAGKTITEIAYSWGFQSSSHFSRTFKDRFGITPRQARALMGTS